MSKQTSKQNLKDVNTKEETTSRKLVQFQKNDQDSDSVTIKSSQEEDTESIGSLQNRLSDYIERTESTAYHEIYPGTETIEYNFSAERQHIYATNLIESIAHLVKGCLGAGILGMHVAFMNGGLWTSAVLTIVIGVVVSYMMLMLVRSAQKMYPRLRVSRLSYPDLIEVAVATGPLRCIRRLSKCFRYTVDLCLFVELCGSCCVYQIVMATTLKLILETLSETVADLKLSPRMYLLIVMAPLLLFCMTIRNMKYLAPFSLVADLMLGICIVGTICYSVTIASHLNERPAIKDVFGLLKFTGICLYSVEGIGVTLPIENNMNRPEYFTTVLQCGMTIVIVCVLIIGFFGYWAWGESCKAPITIHMPMETFPIILEFLLCMTLIITFAVNFWVPFRIVWHYVGRIHKRRRSYWERLYCSLLVIIITSFSIAFPNLSDMMSFLGNFIMALIGFIFPALIECFVTWNDRRNGYIRWKLIKSIFIVLGSGVLCSSSFFIGIL